MEGGRGRVVDEIMYIMLSIAVLSKCTNQVLCNMAHVYTMFCKAMTKVKYFYGYQNTRLMQLCFKSLHYSYIPMTITYYHCLCFSKTFALIKDGVNFFKMISNANLCSLQCPNLHNPQSNQP